jgi:hypothetical protein
MNLSKKQYWFIKDIIFQSIVFFIASFIPTVYIGRHLNDNGTPENYYLFEGLNSNILRSNKPLYISVLYYPIMYFVYSLRESFFISIFNAYMNNHNEFRIKKEDYKAFKILIIFTVNSMYVIWLTLGYGNYVYYLSGIPIMITTIIYLIYKKWQIK